MAQKYQWIRQQSGADCAAASLAIVAKHHGRTFKISRLREVIGTGKGGTTLLGLKQGAENLGFWAKTIKANLDQLDTLMVKAPLPAIIYWQGYHFVVLYGQEGEEYVVSDPGMGIRRLSRAELLKGWQGGILLLLTPHPFWFQAQPNDHTDPWRSALQRLYPYRWTVFGIISLGMVTGLLTLTVPIFVQVLVDRLTQPETPPALLLLLLTFGAIQSLNGLLAGGQRWLATRCAQGLQTGLKLDFGTQVLQLSLAYHEARYASVVRGALRDIGAISQTLNQMVVMLPFQTFSGLAALVVLEVYQPILMLTAGGLGGLGAIATILLHPRVRQASYRSAATAGSNLFLLSEAFKNALTLKTTAAAPQLAAEIQARLHQEAQENTENAQLVNLNQTLTETVTAVGSLVILAVAAFLYSQGNLSLGQVAGAYGLQLLVFAAVNGWVSFWLNFTQVRTAAQLLDELFDCTPENQGDEEKPWLTVDPAAIIQCEQLQFSYPGRLAILEDVSVTLPGGNAIAIIGYSGCGKSTLAKLLTRLYQPTAGAIAIGKTALEDIPLDCLRRQVVLVPQEAEFFTRSIGENLQLAKPDATLPEIQAACQLAAADEFIQTFPEQYDTTLGTFSANLSGGQKQRIAIARALLMNPPILILDEATANLDPPTEKQVMDQLLTHRQGQTTILISHRPNVIERADWVLWLDQGGVKFSGEMQTFRETSAEHLSFLNP